MYEKCASRGNVAVAALVFVTFVGVAAIALDSTRVAQNSRAQLAEAGTATDRGYKANDGTTCVRGYDYLIKLDSEKKPVVYATKTGEEKDAIKLPDGNQCSSLTATVPAHGKYPARQCTETAWKCYVTFCKPKGFSGDALKQQECIFINKPIPVGGGIDKQQAAVDSGFSKDIAKAALSADAKQREEAMQFKSLLPNAMQSNLDSAFSDVKKQEDVVAAAQTNYEEALRQAQLCTQGKIEQPIAFYWCDDKEAVNKTGAEYQKELAKLNAMRESAQTLSGDGKNLTAPPATVPTGTRDVTACVNDASGNCVRDQRTNPEYKPPQTTITDRPSTNSPPSGPSSPSKTTGSGFNPSQLMQMLPALTSLLSSALQSGPSCTLKVSPESISQPGQPVTLSWTTQGAQQAYLSNVGQVGPSGSMQVQPQGATTYSMQVTGMTNTAQQQQTQYAYNPYTNTYMPVPAQQQQGTMQYGNCQVQVKVGTSTSSTANKPTAQISCQPKIADVGMSTAISFACQNSVASSGSGFSTNNELSGNRTVEVTRPTTGSTGNTFGLTCSKEGVTDSAQCTVNVNRPSIVLVATPQQVARNTQTSIGWITGAMESCVISSASLSAFTSENAGNTSTSGVVKTPALSDDTEFTLSCTTKAGGSKTATITVDVQ